MGSLQESLVRNTRDSISAKRQTRGPVSLTHGDGIHNGPANKKEKRDYQIAKKGNGRHSHQ